MMAWQNISTITCKSRHSTRWYIWRRWVVVAKTSNHSNRSKLSKMRVQRSIAKASFTLNLTSSVSLWHVLLPNPSNSPLQLVSEFQAENILDLKAKTATRVMLELIKPDSWLSNVALVRPLPNACPQFSISGLHCLGGTDLTANQHFQWIQQRMQLPKMMVPVSYITIRLIHYFAIRYATTNFQHFQNEGQIADVSSSN